MARRFAYLSRQRLKRWPPFGFTILRRENAHAFWPGMYSASGHVPYHPSRFAMQRWSRLYGGRAKRKDGWLRYG